MKKLILLNQTEINAVSGGTILPTPETKKDANITIEIIKTSFLPIIVIVCVVGTGRILKNYIKKNHQKNHGPYLPIKDVESLRPYLPTKDFELLMCDSLNGVK